MENEKLISAKEAKQRTKRKFSRDERNQMYLYKDILKEISEIVTEACKKGELEAPLPKDVKDLNENYQEKLEKHLTSLGYKVGKNPYWRDIIEHITWKHYK